MDRSTNQPINVAIAGATGGIGQALLKAYQANPNINKIYALSRQVVSGDKIHHLRLDYNDLSTFEALADVKAIDVLVIATGALIHQLVNATY